MQASEVLDNGSGMNDEEIDKFLNRKNDNQNSIGLANIKSRIKILYGNDYGISITSKIGLFTSIKIKLPL